jgi:hypothetical protein
MQRGVKARPYFSVHDKFGGAPTQLSPDTSFDPDSLSE